MSLTNKQLGVFKGVLAGAIISLAIVILGITVNPLGYQSSLMTVEKLSLAILSSMVPAICLAISIGRLARHRFCTPEDIDGSGLTTGTEQAKILQSMLQNTLEQTLLAILSYCAWAIVMPATYLSVVPIAALTFGIGRMMFFIGYKNGAPSRALGFALTFYPSIIMLIGAVGVLLARRFFI